MSSRKGAKPAQILTSGFEKISPNQAFIWLDQNNTINRRIRLSLVDKYARDMTNGKWVTTGDPISFDWENVLLEGQHRLSAVVKSGMTIEFTIVRGLDPKSRMVHGIGAARRPADILKILGWQTNNSLVAIVRSIMNGHNKRASIPEIVDAYETHHEAAEITLAMFPSIKKRIVISPVTGPIARAWYSQDYTKLQTFADILYNGLADRRRKGDASVILLRDYLLQVPSRGENLTREIYGLTETSLSAFLSNQKLTTLEPSKEELFPLPNEHSEE